MSKYGNANAWRYCCKVFDLLTIAAVRFKRYLFLFHSNYPSVNLLFTSRVRNVVTDDVSGHYEFVINGKIIVL